MSYWAFARTACAALGLAAYQRSGGVASGGQHMSIEFLASCYERAPWAEMCGAGCALCLAIPLPLLRINGDASSTLPLINKRTFSHARLSASAYSVSVPLPTPPPAPRCRRPALCL